MTSAFRDAVIRSSVFAVLVALAFVPAAWAVTYLVPEDREMIAASDDIVVASGVTSIAEGNVTRFVLRIEEVLKGDRKRGQHLVLRELGGTRTIVPGAPRYESGRRYLVFTESNAAGDPITFGFSLGQFALDGPLAIRDPIVGFDQNLDGHVERRRDARGFIEYIRGIVAGRAPDASYFVTRSVSAQTVETLDIYSRGSYLLENYRWPSPAYPLVTSGTQPGSNGLDAVANAISQWNGTASDIAISQGPQNDAATCSMCNDDYDGVNVVLFNDPGLFVPTGAVGFAHFGGTGGSHSLDGETFPNLTESDVVIARRSLAQCVLDSVVTHEIGHTLGFRHSNLAPDGTTCGVTAECTGAAIMNASVGCSHGLLRDYDRSAAIAVYGDGPICTPITITAQPSNDAIEPGRSTSLGVGATGTTPLTYQWYVGHAGDVTHPIEGATLDSVNVSPSETTRYWVSVKNPCGEEQSRTAIVSIVCVAPVIAAGPQSQTVQAGQKVSLSVTAVGSGPLAFAWFQGEVGDLSKPVGTNASTFVSESLFRDATFWVRVTNSCGNTTSASAAIRVPPGRRRSVR